MNLHNMKVYIDFKSPASYLAFKPTLALADECGLFLEWKAFKTVQHSIPLKAVAEDKGQRHRRVRAQARQAMHLHYAEVLGVEMNFPNVSGETELALWVLESLALEQRTAFARRCFDAYWVAVGNLQDADQLRTILAQLDEPTMLPSIEQSVAEVNEVTELAQTQDGVVDAPAYVLHQQVFVGREHFPWIRELCANTGGAGS